MREVSLGMAAGSVCSSAVQLTPPAPASVHAATPSASLSQHQQPMLLLRENQPITACSWLLVLPARGEGTVGTQQLTHHLLDACSRVMVWSHPPAVPVCPCSLQGGFTCPTPRRCIMPMAPSPGGSGAPGWHLEAGSNGAYHHRQGCPEELTRHPVSWLSPACCPSAWSPPMGTALQT